MTFVAYFPKEQVSAARLVILGHWDDKKPHELSVLKHLPVKDYPPGLVTRCVFDLISRGQLLKDCNGSGAGGRSVFVRPESYIPKTKRVGALTGEVVVKGTLEKPEWNCQNCGHTNMVRRKKNSMGEYRSETIMLRCRRCRKLFRITGIRELM